ncbi:MAG: winged helix-turn-helix domain-containing protein [Halobacteriales archaeon]|nr:winged helix-turn-helix domain-containing protein [Halobacteriales archaeon]
MAAEHDPNRVIRTFGKKHAVEILEAADEAISVQDLSDELGVPQTTCYRRVEDLLDTGLLEFEDSILSEGQQRVNVYRRNIDELSVGFQGRDFSLSIEERSMVKNKLDDVWRNLPDST